MTPEELAAMKDEDFIVYACRNDQNAARFCLDVIEIAGTWDDLIDRDKDVAREAIDRAFVKALLEIPANPFFVMYAQQLLPIFRGAILNWMIANQFEQGGTRQEMEIAHTLRYAPADVLTTAAAITGGLAWAREVGPELRRRSQREALDAYLKEHGHD